MIGKSLKLICILELTGCFSLESLQVIGKEGRKEGIGKLHPLSKEGN